MCKGPTKSLQLALAPNNIAKKGVIWSIHTRRNYAWPKNGDAPPDVYFYFNEESKDLSVKTKYLPPYTVRPCEVIIHSLPGHFILHDVRWPSSSWCGEDDKDERDESDEENSDE